MKITVLIFWLYITLINATKVLKIVDLQKWENFKITFNKHYATSEEEKQRMKIFKENMRKITKHNKKFEKGEVSSKMRMNQFGDLTEEEFARIHFSNLTLRKYFNKMSRAHENGAIVTSLPPDSDPPPESRNWVIDGAVAPPKNQGTCDCGWAFAIIGAIEAHNFIKTGELISLSEQNLLDCVGNTYLGNGAWVYNGCTGGSLYYPFKYATRKGIETEKSYPYEEVQHRCSNLYGRGIKIRDFKQSQSEDEELLKSIVGLIGPVTSVFAADSEFLQFHSTGIYTNPECKNSQVNHAVLVIGYGTENNEPYWLVKNSWGPYWGDGGLFRIRRGSNECNISLENYYPVF